MLAKTFRLVKQHAHEPDWDPRDRSAIVMGRREKGEWTCQKNRQRGSQKSNLSSNKHVYRTGRLETFSNEKTQQMNLIRCP